MSEVTDLLARIEAAAGPDRELDGAILTALDAEFSVISQLYDEVIGWDTINRLPGKTYAHPAPITASIDAALALVERVKPGWNVRLYIHPDAAYADIYKMDEVHVFPGGEIEKRISQPNYEGLRISDRSPALAILAALLRSIEGGERG